MSAILLSLQTHPLRLQSFEDGRHFQSLATCVKQVFFAHILLYEDLLGVDCLLIAHLEPLDKLGLDSHKAAWVRYGRAHKTLTGHVVGANDCWANYSLGTTLFGHGMRVADPTLQYPSGK